MRKLTAILTCALLLLAPVVSLSQGIIQGTTRRKIFPGNPLFVTNTFVAFIAASGGAYTSPALTLTAGDFVLVFCMNTNTAGIFFTITSTPANTFTNVTSLFQSQNGSMTQAYAFGAGAGSTTFTCTPASNVTGRSMIVLQYHPGFLTVLDTSQTGASLSPATTLTSTAFTTAAKGLIIFCARAGVGAQTFTAGAIGGATATLRGFDLGSNAGSGMCEDTTPATSQSTITAAVSYSTGANATGIVAAFK